MKQTAQQIIADIDAHLQKSSKQNYSDFYIGITNDVERRLFNEHNVSKENAWWIYRQAVSKEHAQAVEEHYLSKGMEGDTGGGTNETVFVYCYEITNQTVE
jgi:hypothetical protein